MGQVIDSVSRVLAQAQARAEIAAQNIANQTTPGYKRRTAFASLLADGGAGLANATDFTPGKPIQTGAPLDLSLAGEGFFVLRSDQGLVYSRQGQFHRDADGRVVDAGGQALQMDAGGDLVLRGSQVTIDADGVVLDGDAPVGRLALVAAIDPNGLTRKEAGAFFGPPEAFAPLDRPSVRQGVLEASNVSAGDEMVAVMEAVRRAEGAQRLANVYDDLLGRAVSTLGQS